MADTEVHQFRESIRSYTVFGRSLHFSRFEIRSQCTVCTVQNPYITGLHTDDG